VPLTIGMHWDDVGWSIGKPWENHRKMEVSINGDSQYTGWLLLKSKTEININGWELGVPIF
jgi:hypothetical protein